MFVHDEGRNKTLKIYILHIKIQQTKMLITCQRFGCLFLFGLVWQYSSVQTKYNKGRFKVMATYFSSNITLSLHSYIGSALNRELNFCNGYLSLLYFWLCLLLAFNWAGVCPFFRVFLGNLKLVINVIQKILQDITEVVVDAVVVVIEECFKLGVL